MAIIYSENPIHRANLLAAEQVRQASAAAAGTDQALLKTAAIVYAKTCLASAIANSCGIEIFVTSLKSLGLTGSL